MNTKKYLSIISVVIIFSWLFVAPSAFGQEVTPPVEESPVTAEPPAAAVPEPALQTGPLTADEFGDLIPFPLIGLEQDVILTGPFSAENLTFGLPASWSLQPGGVIHLEFELFITNFVDPTIALDAVYGGTMEIILNDQVIEVISLNRAGAYSYDLVIPESALEPPDTDRRHILGVMLSRI